MNTQQDRDRGTLIRQERLERLRSLPILRQITTIDDAKSPENIQWCVEQLKKGMRFDELRHSLGLGPANIDHRWRTIRKIILDVALPDNEDQALDQCTNESRYLLTRLNDFLEDLDRKIEDGPYGEEQQKTHHNYWKFKLDALKLLIEENNKQLMNFQENKKIKKLESSKHGVSILIYNNIPRPVVDVSELQQKVIDLVAKSD